MKDILHHLDLGGMVKLQLQQAGILVALECKSNYFDRRWIWVYISTPTITISDPPSGITATAVAITTSIGNVNQ
jgi:hypothetical protein